MAEKFVGSWKRVKLENHEEHMKTVACDHETIKAALIADEEESTLEVTMEGKKFTWDQVNAGKKWPLAFTLDEEFVHGTPHGSYRNLVTMQGDKMIAKHVPLQAGEKTINSERWIEGDRMFEVAKTGDVVCKLEFVRV